MATVLPKVHVLGTGGSISAVGEHRLHLLGYGTRGERLTIQEMLARIPEAHQVARIDAEQFYNLPSNIVGPEEWLGLSRRCNELFTADPELSGIVVTHGTGTMEETAYFLNLTVKSERPVVITAAQRPPSALSTDADINLLDAIRVAAAPQSRGKGVLAAVNNEIHTAREVTKCDTARLETFHPKELGFLGYADSDGQIVFYRAPLRRHTWESEFDVSSLAELPRVDIAYGYAGADGWAIDALLGLKSPALVVAAIPALAMPPKLQAAAVEAVAQGAIVALTSRGGDGRVMEEAGHRRDGFIFGDNLTAQKARILLMLGLTVTRDRDRLQTMFYEY